MTAWLREIDLDSAVPVKSVVTMDDKDGHSFQWVWRPGEIGQLRWAVRPDVPAVACLGESNMEAAA